MKPSLLVMDSFKIRQLTILANEEYQDCINGEESTTQEIEIGIDYNVFKAEGGWKFKIPLDIQINWHENLNNPFNNIELKLDGFFSLPNETEESKVQEYVPILCLANLIGTARGVISQVTGNFPGGAFYLPVIDVSDIVGEIRNKQSTME